MKWDSGSSIHFIREKDQHCLENIFNATGPMIIMSDAGTLQANKHVSLPLTFTLSPASTISTIVPGLKSSSMFSPSQLYEDGYNVKLNKQKM